MTLIRTMLRALVFLPVCIITAEAQVPSPTNFFNRSLKTVEFQTPNEWSFQKYIENPVNLYNGSIDVSIPLYVVTDGEVQLPLTIRYNTSGIKVCEEASWIGLGWNLNVGGYITNQIVDGYDYLDYEYISWSSSFYGDTFPNVHYYASVPFTDSLCAVIGLQDQSRSHSDWGKLSPDVYFFSYPGNSGRYVVNYQAGKPIILQREEDLRIADPNFSNQNQGQYTEKIITTPEGIAHHYYGHYITKERSSSIPISITYTLDETIYPNGSLVTYDYGYYPMETISKNAYGCGTISETGGSGNFYADSDLSHGETYIDSEESYISKITTPNYIIDFVVGNRLDIVSSSAAYSSKKLEAIIIRDRHSNNVLKRFAFSYGYLGDTGATPAKDNLRLCLESISEVSPNTLDTINRYSFSYNQTPLPSKKSYSSDYWGYPNSSVYYDPQVYVPDLAKLYWNRTPGDDLSAIVSNSYPKYDKSHDYNYCQAGMLKSITYPTGGRTEFTFESNSFWGTLIPSHNEQPTNELITEGPIYDRNNSNDVYYVSITRPSSQEYTIEYTLTRGLNTWEELAAYHPGILIPFSNSGVNQGTLLDLATQCLQLHQNGDSRLTISGSIQVNSPNQGTTVFQVTFPDQLGDQFTSSGKHGEMRAEILYREGNSHGSPTDTVSYGCGMRIARVSHFDSGRNEPLYSTNYTYLVPGTQRSSGILFEKPRFANIYNDVAYSILPYGGYSPSPRLVHTCQFELYNSSLSNNPYGWNGGVGYSNVTVQVDGEDGYKVFSFYNTARASGSQYSVEIGHPLNGKMESEKDYDVTGTLVHSISYLYNSTESVNYSGVSITNNWNRFPELINPYGQLWNTYYYVQHTPSYYENFYTIVEYELSQNDITLSSQIEYTDGVSVETDYTYDQRSLLLTSETFTDSSGDIMETRFTYPKDYSSSDDIYKQLDSNKHIVSPIVEQRTLRNGALIYSRLETYDSYGHTQGVYHSHISPGVSDTTSAFVNESPNPILYPVASVLVINVDGRRNPLSFKLGGLEDEIYLWGYGHRYPIARIKGLTYNEVSSALGGNLPAISAALQPDFSSIDALRSSFPSAQIETYQYDNLGNITSITDASGNQQSLGYDVFGRLTSISRKNGTISETTDSYSYSDTSITHNTYFQSNSSYCDVKYYNGIGLLDQLIQVASSPDGKSVVKPYYYDASLRESRSYVPYLITDGSSTRRQNPLSEAGLYWLSSRENEHSPFSEIVFESAPISRIVKEYGIGEVFHSLDKPTSVSYRSNQYGEVRRLTVSSDGYLSCNNYYGTGTLFVTVSINPDGGKVMTYKTKSGLVILERTEQTASVYADTYYVYDNYLNLIFVVTPEGSSLLTYSCSYLKTSAFVQDYCFVYEYDDAGRQISSRVPGGGINKTWYDDVDRPLLFRNAIDESNGSWILYNYDSCGRLIEQRKFNVPVPDSYVVSHVASFINAGNLDEAFIFDCYPTDMQELAFSPVSGIVSYSDLRTSTNGLLLQDKIRDISTEGIDITYAYRRYFYDKLGRLVQKVEKTPLGDIVRTSTKYDYRDNPIIVEETSSGITKREYLEYDSRFRLIADSTYIGSSKMASGYYDYDFLGKPVCQLLGNGIEKHMTYTIQGWNSSVTATNNQGPLFSSTLRYYDSFLNASPLYSGNPSSWSWRHPGQIQDATFIFSYDLAGRLLGARQYEGNVQTDSFTEKGITYDKNGNILTLGRYESGIRTDSLSFSYAGNRRNGYSYDQMGSITRKPGDNYTIGYSRINLPSSIIADSGYGQDLQYRYLADGTKISVISSSGEGYKYAGTAKYNVSGNVASFESTSFPEGRIVRNPNTGAIETQYHLKDHLGNVRVIIDANGTVLAKYDYTPYGAVKEIGTPSLVNDYTFSGKEKQSWDDVWDFGARFYSPKTVTWSSVDPMAEKYPSVSPYVYCAGNPIVYSDRLGMSPIYSPDGVFLGTDDEGLKGQYIIMDASLFTQGMTHDDAISNSLIGPVDKQVTRTIKNHFRSLKSRPDYDGFVTISEGISWAKTHIGARDNPTPDNMLYVDASTLNFGALTSEYLKEGEVSSINLYKLYNLPSSLDADARSTIYALGRCSIILNNDGTVTVVNDAATDYDWNRGGPVLRDIGIQIEKWRAGIPDGAGFKVYYYGRGKVNRKPKINR